MAVSFTFLKVECWKGLLYRGNRLCFRRRKLWINLKVIYLFKCPTTFHVRGSIFTKLWGENFFSYWFDHFFCLVGNKWFIPRRELRKQNRRWSDCFYLCFICVRKRFWHFQNHSTPVTFFFWEMCNLMGWGWMGWDGTGYQKCPSIFFILCGYIDHVYVSLYIYIVKSCPHKFLVGLKFRSSWGSGWKN